MGLVRAGDRVGVRARGRGSLSTAYTRGRGAVGGGDSGAKARGVEATGGEGGEGRVHAILVAK